jgi:hypothetical protein
VFLQGSMHLVGTDLDFSISVNPHSCLARVTRPQSGEVTGGTGQFAGASGSSMATVTAQALLTRNPDGSCSCGQVPVHEVDGSHRAGRCRSEGEDGRAAVLSSDLLRTTGGTTAWPSFRSSRSPPHTWTRYRV